MKLSYSSFEVYVSDISWKVLKLFLSYCILIASISIGEDQLYLVVLTVSILFLGKLKSIFVVTILWLEDTPSKKEYDSILP